MRIFAGQVPRLWNSHLNSARVAAVLRTNLARPCGWTMDPVSETVSIVECLIDQMMNDGGIDAVDALWTQDMQWHGAGAPEVKGYEA